MIDKTFIEKIEQMSKVETIEIDGLNYTSKGVYPVKLPEVNAIHLTTLTGVKDYLSENSDGIEPVDVMIHVADFQTVSVISPVFGDFRQREVLVRAQAHRCGFDFDRFIDRENFQIGLMASFMPTAMRDQVLRYVTGIVQSESLKTADDGISQRVTARQGIARVTEVDLPNPVTLQPYRTFIEAQQPESDFVFRVRQEKDDRVTMALFEADGGRWKLQAALNIKEWLVENIPGARVIV